jgi:cobalamin biosynthesis protein CobD/CbiB
MFLVCMLCVFHLGGHIFLHSANIVAEKLNQNNRFTTTVAEFIPWIFEVCLVETTISMQLLCTITLQMARFLERNQIHYARSQLSWLCSRDPSNLNAAELAGATLESLSVIGATI